MLDSVASPITSSNRDRDLKRAGKFQPHIILSYLTESNGEHEFHFDLDNRNHRNHCLSILRWAARNDVEIHIVSKRVVSAKEQTA